MAEELLRNILPESWRERVAVSSAGIAAADGLEPSREALLVMEENGLDGKGLRSSCLTDEMIREADLIITLGGSHLENIRARDGAAGTKAVLLHDLEPAGKPAAGTDVADPFGGPLERYREIFREIRVALEEGWPAIERILSEKK